MSSLVIFVSGVLVYREDKQTDRQTNRQTDRQTDRQAHLTNHRITDAAERFTPATFVDVNNYMQPIEIFKKRKYYFLFDRQLYLMAEQAKLIK